MNCCRLFLLSALMLFGGQSLWSQTVNEILFEGNRKVELETLRLSISSKIGNPLSENSVREDIYKLYELGYFEAIEVAKRVDKNPDGTESLILIYRLKEKPSIKRIEFEGVEEFEDDHFQDKIAIKPFTIINEEKISDDLVLIEKEYVDKGYYLVDVDYQLHPESEYEVVLKYVVKEHSKVKVRAVHFIGNHYFSDLDLRDKLMIREFNRFSWMSTTGLYKDEAFDRDTRFLEFYYMDNGFVRVKVETPNVLLSPDKEWIDLTFSIEEGEQYYVSHVDITGDIITDKDNLLGKLKSKSEKLYRHSQFIQDIETLTDYYADFGYAFVNVNPQRPVDDDKKLVSITYDIQKGEKVYFGEVEIIGNDKTRDNVIRRQLLITDGALYSGTKLKKSKQEVERLGFFKEVVVRTEKIPGKKKVKVIVSVKEKTTGSFQVGVGYSPNQGAFFTSQISENNVLGYGQRVGLNARFNPEGHFVQISWREPYLMDTDWNVGTSLYKMLEKRGAPDEESNPYKEDKIGGRVSVGHPIWNRILLHVAYKLERLEFIDIDPVFISFYQSAITSSVELTLERNTTNNYLDPSAGSLMMSSFEYAGKELGGDRDFSKWKNQFTHYTPWMWTDHFRTYFRMNAEFAYLFPNSDKKLPINERFKSGGIKSNRGYPWNVISPDMPILFNPYAFPRYLRKGGNRMLQINLEYYVPLIAEAGLKGLVFLDASQVYDDADDFTLSTLKYGTGMGLRWITPIAPLRFELGWPYDPETNELGDKQLHFYIGP